MQIKSYLLGAIGAAAFLAAPANAQSLGALPDNTPISISGTVVSSSPDSFLLDYGSGLITVEMDDFDSIGDAYGIIDGDRVTVTGDVDNDLFQNATIEAGSVYVEGLQQYFFANSADEEAVMATSIIAPVALGQTVIRGTVSNVNEGTLSFTVDAGVANITVDTADMMYNPLDNYGYQQIDVGDRVSVTGYMDNEFFQGRVLDAELITVLQGSS